MEIDQLLNFIGAILGGGIIGAIISALATIFYGERRVETLRRRREHSIKLNDEFFKKWLNKVGDYSKIRSIDRWMVYSKDIDEMVGVEPKDPTDLEFFDEAKSHLESKYPDILKDWKELKRATFAHNKELAAFLEELRALIVKELEMPCYYRGMRGDLPERYVMPDRLVFHIYDIISHEIRTGRKWFGGKPNVNPVISGDVTFYELRWWNDPTLVKSRNRKETEKYVPLIKHLVEVSKYKDKVEKLLKKEDEVLQPMRENFEQKIKDLIKSIELGNILKGKCRFCP